MSRSGDDDQGIEHAVGAALHAQLPKVFEQAFRSELVAPLVDRINSLESLLIEHLQHGSRGGDCPSCQQRCRTEYHERHAKGAWAPPVAESNSRCRSQDTKAEHWVSECGPICEGTENEDYWQQADADGDIVPAGSGSACGAEPGAVTDEDIEETRLVGRTFSEPGVPGAKKSRRDSGGFIAGMVSNMSVRPSIFGQISQRNGFLGMLRNAAKQAQGNSNDEEDTCEESLKGQSSLNKSSFSSESSPRSKAKSILKAPESRRNFEDIDSVHPSGEQQQGSSFTSQRRFTLSTLPSIVEQAAASIQERRSSVPIKLPLQRQPTARSNLNLMAMEMNAEFRSTVFEAANRKSKKGAPVRFSAWLLGAILWGPVMPYSTERVIFLIAMALICFANAMHVPFVISFGIPMCNDDGHPKRWQDMYWIQSILYIVNAMDISISSRSAYFDPSYGLMITNRKAMALRYLRTWFLADMIILIPLLIARIPSLCTDPYAPLSQILLLTKLIKVTNNHVLERAMAVARRQLGIVGAGQMQRLIVFFTIGAMLIHWSSCAFHYIAYLSPESRMTWVDFQDLNDSDNTNKYITAMYWTICTLTTVGYGDVKAENIPERIYCVCVMLVGVSLFAYVLGSVSNLINTLNKRGNEIAVRVASVESFLKRHQMPQDLAKRLSMHSAYVMERSLDQEDKDILSTLSESLRTQAILHMYSGIIEKLRFFKDKPPQLTVFIIENLKLELQAPGEVIMLEDNIGEEMYFVGEGLLEVWVSREFGEGSPEKKKKKKEKKHVSDQKFRKFIEERARKFVTATDFDLWDDMDMDDINFDKVAELEGGEFFGEYSCLLGRKRACSVTAAQASEIYILSKKILESALEKWPELAVELNEMVESVLAAKDGVTMTSNIVTQLERNADKPTVYAKELIDLLRDNAAQQRLQNAQGHTDMSAWSRKIIKAIRGQSIGSPTTASRARARHNLKKASRKISAAQSLMDTVDETKLEDLVRASQECESSAAAMGRATAGGELGESSTPRGPLGGLRGSSRILPINTLEDGAPGTSFFSSTGVSQKSGFKRELMFESIGTTADELPRLPPLNAPPGRRQDGG